MDNIAGKKSGLTWAVHISVALMVAIWLFPTVGLFVSSFRTTDQIATSGWWKAMFPAEQSVVLRTGGADDATRDGDNYVLEGNLFEVDGSDPLTIGAWGTSARDVNAYGPGDTGELRRGGTLMVAENGDYRLVSAEEPSGRGQRVFVTAMVPPEFTLNNYDTVLGKDVAKNIVIYGIAALLFGLALKFIFRSHERGFVTYLPMLGGFALFIALAMTFGLSEGRAAGAQTTDNMGRAFFSTLTVTIPATIIPICIAAFAAYALAWMDFPGRALLIAIVVGLLVVPLQLALIPLLKLHLQIGIGKGYLGVWLAHTAFGLPLATYLLRNYMVGLPRDIIENAKVDGATDFQIFTRIILPLSFPALASFAIFQFLWTWNDLLVAKVFLIDATGSTSVMTNQIVELLGTRGGNWEILATAAFVSIAVPLVVFFMMQKYLVRGLLAGSVK
ncbi:carbohydrate ABC transporter permease [Psychromarinibacter halotolerans]|uniref:Carbohydrate ABC transporter permease n=1 Tax=Psychromarinibacter halotolerans TaxID=1775175 RepID=A0ABV7GU16_9RHOB|nr:carbohydrate ABC transporter permease [Psychromarinibacter halotolerans]MDF0594761.1 carbohydrate ABC transporter permease [Psychromarinibacter halotolerans]